MTPCGDQVLVQFLSSILFFPGEKSKPQEFCSFPFHQDNCLWCAPHGDITRQHLRTRVRFVFAELG